MKTNDDTIQKIARALWMLLVLSSCQSQNEQSNLVYHNPKVVETRGYIVPVGSISEPKAIPAGKPKIVEAGQPKIVPANTNVVIAGKPKIVLAGVPKVNMPGQGSYSMPKTLPALENTFDPGKPETVIVKDASFKENNPSNFSSYSKLQGLRHGNIRCMMEDRLGNLWLGSWGGGLSRYDGKSFTHFTFRNGLKYVYIWCVLEDHNGNIWFGTAGEGLAKFDGKKFISITTAEGIDRNGIQSIIEDHLGNIWFGTPKNGAFKYDGKNITHYSEKEGLCNNTITSIYQDHLGNIWFGTTKGVSKFDGSSFTNFSEKEGLPNNFVRDIIEDNNKNMWFATDGGGVSKFDGKTFSTLTITEGLTENRIRKMLQDKLGNMWFATITKGAIKYDGKTFTDFSKKEGLTDNGVASLLQDRSGNIWLGTVNNGFSRYDGNLFTHFTEKDGLSHNSILSIVQDPKGNLWFGTNGNGITRYDGKTFAQFTMKEGAPNIINDIIVDTSGNLWFAANDNGMCKYDGKSFIYFTKKEGLADNIVSTIFQDHLGNLWIGTFGGGVSKYDGKSFTNFTQKEGLYDNRIYSICEDRDGNIWFGTFEHGAAKYDGKTFTYFTTKEGFSHNFVLSVKSDHLGNIWLGTYGGGVAMYDGKSFTFFTEKEGLCSNFTCDIYEDKAGNIWFGTYFGLSRLDYGRFYKNENIVYEDKGKTRNIHFTNYKYEDGFLGIGCTKNAIFEAFDGTVWVGSSGMLSAYHPPIKEEKVDSSAPNIQLTSITLFNEKIDWTNLEHKKDSIFKLVNGVTISNFKFDSLSKWYNLPEHLSLAFDNNFLTFNFIGITLSQPQKVQYQFILEGIDKNWSAMTGRTEAPYGNLPNGTYTFRVKAMNSKGYWSDEFTYTFTIRPPWYFTWWAYLIWMASAIGIAYYFYRFMLNRRLQQSESIRLKELDAIKTRLYTNITHEFRTPLTIILGMADQVITNPKEWFHEGIRLIRRNGKQLLLLVNQLLDLSKLESGTMALHLKQGDIVQYFRYIYESFESFAASKGVAMHLKTELNELQMDYDPEKVQNIVSNLLSNAIKYTPEGGEVTLTLALGKENSLIPTENHKMLKIAVTDSGIGIPEEKIPYIFDRFYQIDDSTTRHAEGTGIGLTLTKELVNLLGGTIEVKSETGQGSTFIIVLPITQNEPFADIEPIEKIEPENTEGPLLTTISTIEDKKKPLVLLVEDNADVVRYIRICLKNEYRIESASNGLMGLEKSMDLIPDIIISDVMMPEMDGFELCQKLKTDIRTSHIPIVLLTAKADADSKIEGLQYGADEYLSKPFEERELKARLKNLLTLRKALQSRYGAPQYWQETRAHEAIEIKLSLDDAFLENLKTIIEENISDVGFDIHHLERELGMSRTKIYRKLTALTDMSATEFIRSVRLTKASEILRGDKAKTISEIAYDVGFTSLSYFTRRFHEMFGVSPTEWREGKKT